MTSSWIPQKRHATHLGECDIRVVVLVVPYFLIQQSAPDRLEQPADGRDHAKDTGEDVALREHGDGVDETG